MALDVEVYPKMPRNKSKAVPEGNDYVLKDAYVLLGEITLEKIRRTLSEALDTAFDKPTEKMRNTRQRSAGLEQEARQPRLTKEADVKPDIKTLEYIALVIFQRASDLRGYYRLKPHDCLSTTVVRFELSHSD